jgi:ABC-type glycerol-3-phosphate transport system substrate-binding protein
LRRFTAILLSTVLFLGCALVSAPAAAGAEALKGEMPFVFEGQSYASLGPVPDAHIPHSAIVLSPDTYSSASGVSILDGYIDRSGPILALDEGFVSFTVDVPRDGRYCIALSYAAMPGSRANIELSVEIDGFVPFREAQVVQFTRWWQYSSAERSFDNRGNMLRPSSEEIFTWRNAYVTDMEGFYTEPFAFFLPAGTREITLRSVREPVAISEIRLTPPPNPIPYAELSASYDPRDAASAGPVTVLAVDSTLRNSSSVLPIVDLTNPLLEPFSLTTISYNTMGGDMWSLPGQAIAWELEIPSDGLYALSFIYRQDAVVGLPVTRILEINGEVPFAEARAIVFPYHSNWQRLTINADGEDALVWLSKGTHEISLTVTLGPTADICRRVSEISSELSAIYTRIIMVTGPYPDHMRDYRIDERLPDIMKQFAGLAVQLDQLSADITALGGGRNDAMMVSIVARQLHDFIRRPDSIPGRLPRFKDNIINLAIWVLIASEMPLTLYSVSAAPPGAEFPPIRPGFFRSIAFFFVRFFSSFTSRAENAGNSYDPDEENLIEVWGQYGMDLSELLKRLIDEEFTRDHEIKVNYNIIFNESHMFFNLAAGTGPDVCLSIAKGFPLDFGLRGAAVDLAPLPGYAEFEALFPQTSMYPHTWDGKVYGFPVIHHLPVMFVRTDIFRDLGLKIPDTWDEFYAIIGELGVRNLQISAAGDLMPLFVLQRGGSFFNDDLSASVLDDPIGIEALTEWTNLFTLHGAPVQIDFFNRFRTGETPIGINDYSLYNMLEYAALEIKGSWAIFPVPGIMREDGTIDRTIVASAGANNAVASSSGFITASRPDRIQDSWEFVQWFMSVETQTDFALGIEALFGPAARYNTATYKAQESINWSRHSFDTIMTSIGNLREIPGVPGAYYVGRHTTNMFNEIVLMGESPRAAMRKYIETINAEITRKRLELGID